MSWHRVDDCWPDHPRLADLDAGTVAAWFALLAHCSRNQTDGEIAKKTLKRIRFCTPKRIEKLLQRELLVDIGGSTVWMHDYLEYQDSKAATRAKREQWRDRQSRHRSRVTTNVTTSVTHASTKPNQLKEPRARGDDRAQRRSKHAAAVAAARRLANQYAEAGETQDTIREWLLNEYRHDPSIVLEAIGAP